MVYKHSELLCFWALSIVRNSKYKKTQRFRNRTCFRPQVREEREREREREHLEFRTLDPVTLFVDLLSVNRL
jgi:hypothetical protein